MYGYQTWANSVLRFLTWLFGPVFAREMIETSRRRRTYLLRVGYGLVCLYLAYLVWEPSGVTLQGSLGRAELLSSKFFDVVTYFQILAILVAMPMMLAGSIAGERRAGTLDLMFTTHLSDREIVQGKLASRLLVLTSLLLTGVPLLTLFSWFGGFSLKEVLRIELDSLTVGLAAGAISLHVSTGTTNPVVALVQSYARIALLFSAWLVLAVASRGWDQDIFHGISILSLMILSVIYLHWATRRLHVPPPPRKKWGTLLRRWIKEWRAPAAAEGGQAADTAATSGPFSASRRLWGPLQIGLVEVEPPLRKNLWVFAILAGAFVLNVVAIHQYEGWSLARILSYFWAGSWLLTLAVSLSNPLFVRRPGFFDLLLTTLLEPTEILQGSLWVSWPLLSRVYLFPVLLSCMWAYANSVATGALLVTGLLVSLLIVALGTLCSLADPRGGHRVLPATIAAVVIFAGPWIVPRQLAAAILPWHAAITATGLLLMAVLWVRRSIQPAALGSLVVAAYGCLASWMVMVPMAWRSDLPAEWLKLYSPWHWLTIWASRRYRADEWSLASAYVPCYWIALATLLVALWIWTAMNLDEIVGRGRRTWKEPA